VESDSADADRLPPERDVDRLADLRVTATDMRDDAKQLADATGRAARRWRRLHYGLGGPAAVIAAVAGVSAVQNDATLAGISAIASAVLTSLMTWLNPGSTAGSYIQTSRQYAAVYTRIEMMLRFNMGGGASYDDSKAELMSYQDELVRIRDASPPVSASAVDSTTLKIMAQPRP
jgi:hypothetical protein